MGLGVIDPGTAILITAGVNTAIGFLTNRKNGMQKNKASQIVDSVEVELQRIVSTWKQIEPKTIEAQNTFLKSVLENFDKTKYFLMDPQLGDYGLKAITERFGTYDPITGQGVRGTGGNGWTDWWSYYWFPIKDSVVVNGVTGQPVMNSGSGLNVSGGNGREGFGVPIGSGGVFTTQQGGMNWVLLGGLGLGVYFLMKGK